MGGFKDTLKDALRQVAFQTSVDKLKKKGVQNVNVLGIDRIAGLVEAAVDRALKTRLIANNIDLEAEVSEIVDEQAFALVQRRADLENEAARVYASAFTEEELKAISAFYTTDAGKKLLSAGPIATREIAKAARIWTAGIERDLLENVSKALNDAGLRANTAEGGDAQTGGN